MLLKSLIGKSSFLKVTFLKGGLPYGFFLIKFLYFLAMFLAAICTPSVFFKSIMLPTSALSGEDPLLSSKPTFLSYFVAFFCCFSAPIGFCPQYFFFIFSAAFTA